MNMPTEFLTKRRDHRLELCFPVRFALKDGSVQSFTFEGEAVDFHSRGVCVMSQRAVPPGALVDVQLFLPKNEKAVRTPAKVKWIQRVPGVSNTSRLGMQFPRELDVALPISCLQQNFNQLLRSREMRWHLFRQTRDSGSEVIGGSAPVVPKEGPEQVAPPVDPALPQILLIDDDSSLTGNLPRLLAGFDFEVSVASSGENGLEILRNRGFHVVLLDLQLPQMSGVDVLRNIKEVYPDTEVIIWTDFQTGRNAIECLNLGAFHYFIKPVPFSTLKETLERAVDRFRQRETTRSTADCFRALFNMCSAGMVVLSPEGLFLDANEMACDLFGTCREEIIGTSVLSMVATNKPEATNLQQVFVSASDQPFSLAHDFIAKDGSARALGFSGGWIFDADGHPASAVALVQKI